MTTLSYNLTKSKITTGLHCPQKLWFDINNKLKKTILICIEVTFLEKRLKKFMVMDLIYQIILKKILFS